MLLPFCLYVAKFVVGLGAMPTLRMSLPNHDPEMKMMPISRHPTQCLPSRPGLPPILAAAFDLPLLFENAPFDVKPFHRARHSRKLLESFSNTLVSSLHQSQPCFPLASSSETASSPVADVRPHVRSACVVTRPSFPPPSFFD